MHLRRRRSDRIQSVHISVSVNEMLYSCGKAGLTRIALTAASCRLHNMTQIRRAEFAEGRWGGQQLSVVLGVTELGAIQILTEALSSGGYRLP